MKKLFKGLIPIFIGIGCGYISGKIVYKIYNDEIVEELSSSKIYLIEDGEYETYDEMRFSNSDGNYMYYIDDNGYMKIVGITKDIDNANKIKNLYDGARIVDNYYVSKEMIDDSQEVMEEKLKKAPSDEEIKEVSKEILDLYKDEGTMRLVLVK